MPLLCFARSHAARPSDLWNQGLCFSSCRRCGRSMVRGEAGWQMVPRGFRIVWKPVMRPAEAGPEEMVRNLPMVIPKAPPRGPSPVPIRAVPKKRSGLRQASFADLVFLGVRLLAWYGAAGFDNWRRNITTRRLQRRAPMLMLAR
jgi:hypothetical protein